MRFRPAALALPVALAVLLVCAPLIALAANYNQIGMQHNNAYDGTNNYQTASQGVWYVETPDAYRYRGYTGNVYWSQNSINWIRNSTQSNRYQPSLVLHAFKGGGGNNCDGGYYESSWSNLLGSWGATKPSAIGCDNNELRQSAGLPWSMNPWQVYAMEGTWVNTSGGTGELTFDNYWFDTQPPAWNPGGVIIRDYQAKLCFNGSTVAQAINTCL